jgi:branched-chain amino acid transport system substrate-binding protein
MATVYKAYQPSLDRYVAVKVLPPYFAHEPGFAMRFTREAKAIAKLNHPNILPIYDFGQEGDLSYIVMKYVEAGTLKDIIGQPLALDMTADIIRQVAAALDHAHQRGILHRDVKPSNMLLDEGRWVLLTDFGLAKMMEGSAVLTASGVGVGTPAYMAPEQGQGNPVDARADIYSLGVVLYETLTGRVPFQAETPMAIVIKHITDPLPLPRSVAPEIPDAVERVILKALAKDPDDRFATTTAMADALTAAVSVATAPAPETIEIPMEEPTAAAPPPAPMPTPPPAVPPEEPTPVPTPSPPATEAPARVRKPFPWKVIGAVAGLILVALAVTLVASNLGGKGGVKKTPTVAASATERAVLVTKAVPTATPKREPTPTQKPSRPGEELRDVYFDNMYLESDFEAPSELREWPDGWTIGDDGSGNRVLIVKDSNTLVFPDSMEWPVYTLDMRVMLAEGEEGQLLIHRAEGQSILLFFADNCWELVQQPDDRIVDRYEANNMEVWHQLRVVVVEDRLAAFLDDDLMFDAEVGPLPGIVGLRAYKGSKIFVDDLHIAGPSLAPGHGEAELYDDFDQGFLEEGRWDWQPASGDDTMGVDDRGVLVIEAKNREPEPRHGRLQALIDRPILAVEANLTVEHLEGEFTALYLFMAAEGGRMAGIMGEGGNVAASEEEGEPIFLLDGQGLPAEYHLRLALKPDGLMHVFVNGREVGGIPAPPVAESFAITYRLDPGGLLIAHVDNVQVHYFKEGTMPSQSPLGEPLPCEDELGCVVVSPGEPIHIAYLLDTSGAAASIGEDSLRGVEIAVDQKGGILDHPIELTGEDSGCNRETGKAAAAAIAADPSVVAVIGTSCSTAASEAAPVISQAGLVMVSPSNTRGMLTDPETHEPGYLRVAPNDKAQAEVAAHFAREVLGVERVATLHEDSHTEALQRVFAEVFQEMGGEITMQTYIELDEALIRSTLSSIALTEPELIFYPLFVEMGGNVTRLARETPGLEGTLLMGADGMLVPELLEVAGPAAEGVYLSSPDFPVVGDEYEAFLEAYRRMYGDAPRSPFHAYAYDATMLVLAAIEQVAEPADDGALYIGRQALRDALFATRDFAGLTGNLTCTPHGDCADVRISVYQVVDAALETWEPGRNPERVWP